LGYEDIHSTHSYIQFSKKSPIDLTKIKKAIKDLYLENYDDIEIISIETQPRSYVESIPKEYTIGFAKKAYLKNYGNLFLRTLDNKKIFFNYKVYAKVGVLQARKSIHKDEPLSRINTKKETIILNKFRSMPLNDIDNLSFQAKHNIKKGKILTKRDVTKLYVVKKGSNINVTIVDKNMAISFRAKANKDARVGDTITATNYNGKKIKVLVTGKNIAEIR